MRLGVATIDFLRADIGGELFRSLGLSLFGKHYSHHTATTEVFDRFSRRISSPVHFISDGSRLRRPSIFSANKTIVSDSPDIDNGGSPELCHEIALNTTEMCVNTFKRRYALGLDEVIWVHFFRLTHYEPIWKDYNFRAYTIVNEIKGLISECPGNWIVSADHGIAKNKPYRDVGVETLHVPLASNCLPANDGYTNHDMLAEFINSGDFSGSWDTLECYDSLKPGCPRYDMRQDGTLIAIDLQTTPSAEDIHNRLKELGYA